MNHPYASPEWADSLWQHDPVLVRLHALATAPGSRVRAVSLDFFDTLVLRLAARPTDVFFEVGLRLQQAGHLAADCTPESFEVYRRVAERKAREKHIHQARGREDVTLAEIYRQLAPITASPAAPAVEVATEQDLCLLNPAVFGLAQELRRHGLRVLVVSDVYLSADHLRAILQANGVPADFLAAIITSSDAGVCKGTGHLFDWVLERLQLKPEELLHLGDNLSADVVGARRAGVRGLPYVPADLPELQPILQRESVLLGGHHPWFSLDALRQLAARHFTGKSPESVFARQGAFTLGPVLTRFAEWACDQFEAAGVRRVGAFMREGELLGPLLQNEARRRHLPLEVLPLFANRTSIELAAVGRLTADNVIDWLQRRSSLAVGTIIDHLGIAPASRRNLELPLTEKLDRQDKIMRLADFLFREEIARQIEQRSREERRLFMDYFTAWLDDNPIVGVCDLGYNATAQWQIQRILQLENRPTRLLGCYVVTTERAAERVLEGLEVRDFLGTFGHPAWHLAAFLRSPAFIELCLNAPIGTTLGYTRDAEGRVKPVLEDTPSSAANPCCAAFKRGVEAFQKVWHWQLQRRPVLGDSRHPFARHLRQSLDRRLPVILGRLAAFPLTQELEHYGGLQLDDRYLESGLTTILHSTHTQAFREQGYVGLLNNPKALWPQGVFHQNNSGSATRFFQMAEALLRCRPQNEYELQTAPLRLVAPWDLHAASLQALLQSLAPQLPALGSCSLHLIVAQEEEAVRQLPQFHIPSGVTLSFVEKHSPTELHHRLNEVAAAGHEPWIWLLPRCQALPALPWSNLLANPQLGACLPHAAGLLVRHAAWQESCMLPRSGSFAQAIAQVADDLRTLGWQVEADQPAATASTTEPPVDTVIAWQGTFADHGSLSGVNRALTGALEKLRPNGVRRVSMETNAPLPAHPAVVVRHAWPPDWQRPRCRKFVVIQPWEYGRLPAEWVQRAAQVDQFWVPSTYVQKVYVESGVPAAKVRVVPNGVDVERYHPAAPPRALPTRKRFKFLFVGGTIFRKGPDALLEAYFKAFTAADEVCLIIKDFGGDSVYAGQTMGEKIRALQQQPNAPEILYLNEDWPDEAMPGLYTACDCLVHPYRGEGFGLPVLEAMACGLPVVVTRGGGADDFTPDDLVYAVPAQRRSLGTTLGGMRLAGEGWVLEPDRQALVRWLRHVVEQPEEARQKGRQAAVYVRSHWTWAAAAEKALACLKEWEAATEPVRARVSPSPAPQPVTVTLPPAGRLGNLQRARELFQHQQWRPAWEAALKAIEVRPYHPEAYLLLAEIARAINDMDAARRLAERSRQMAPGWKAPRKFLNQLHGHGRARCQDWPQPPAAGAKPRLTVALIVKNEEAFLERCLASVKEVANQMVVVDTGSTDRTVEIARAHGAEVHHFAWCDDFSAARNAMLEHVRGDWVLMLDADEELKPESRERLREELSNPKALAYRLPMEDAGSEAEGCSYVPRLWRNAPGLFFIGRVHEQIFSSLEVRRTEWGLENLLSRATLRHYGYTAEVTQSRGKVERNLRLLQQAVQELPDEPNLLMSLGLELARSGRLEEALVEYEAAFQSLSAKPAAEVVPELRESLLMQYTSHLMQARRFAQVIRVLRAPLAVQHGGLTASLHFALGLALLEERRPAEAAVEMRACLARRGQPCLSRINRLIHTAAPHHCLAQALAQAGREAEARQAFAEGVAHYPEHVPLRWDYARWLWQRQEAVPALEQLHVLVSADAQRAEAWQLGAQIALSRPEYYEFALDWTGEAVKCHSDNKEMLALRAEALLVNGGAEEALPLLRPLALNGHFRLHAARILCELALAQVPAPLPVEKEAAVSLEFIGWYRRLIDSRGAVLLPQVNQQLESLAQVLPSAARLLRAALHEADGGGATGAENHATTA